MNVSKIRSLSKQYKSLKDFHKACNDSNIQLIARGTPYNYADILLDRDTTKPIISEVRLIVWDRISDIEKETKKEATNG